MDNVKNFIIINLLIFCLGKLHMDVVTYIWDQYMIGSDVPGFNQSYLSVVTAVHLALLADKFKTCDTVSVEQKYFHIID